MKKIDITHIHIPDLYLSQRDAHKLRGFIAQKFGKKSNHFYNHDQNGEPIYRYPLIQYKVISGDPHLIGMEEGAELLNEIFLDVDHVELSGKTIQFNEKYMTRDSINIGVDQDLIEYRFDTLWMALNQNNYKEYLLLNEHEKRQRLKQILTGNVISFFKGVDYFESDTVLANLKVEKRETQFKNQPMIAFKGRFTSNVSLPDFIGIGKSVARGFGAIRKVN